MLSGGREGLGQNYLSSSKEIVLKLGDGQFSDTDLSCLAEQLNINYKTVDTLHILMLQLTTLEMIVIEDNFINLSLIHNPLANIFTSLSYLATDLKSLRLRASEVEMWLTMREKSIHYLTPYLTMKDFIK